VLETAVPDTPAGRDAPTFQPNIVKGKRRAPALPLGVVVLIGGHVIFFNRLRHAGCRSLWFLGWFFWRLPNIWECSALCIPISVDAFGIESS
jgi:hypothetical protein